MTKVSLLLLSIVLLCSCAASQDEDTDSVSSALGGIAFVQVASADPQSSPTSVAVKYAKAQVAGDLNVVAICWFNSTSNVTSVVDTKGNAYAVAAPVVRYAGGPASCTMYYAPHILAAAANGNTVTVTFSPKVLDPDVRIAEYSGLATSPLDVSAAGTGTTALASSGNATTTQAGDLIVGADYLSSSTNGPGAGFTSRVITSPDSDILEDEIAGAAGAYAATAPTSGGSGGWWVMQMAAFRAATVADAGAEAGSDAAGPTEAGKADGSAEAGPDGSAEAGSDGSADAGGDASTGDGSADAGAEAGLDASGDAAVDAASDGSADGEADAPSEASASDDGGGNSLDATVDATVDSGSATATLVQHVSGSNLRANAMASPYCYTMQLPAPTQAGNTVVVSATWKGTATLMVHDDEGDVYTNRQVFSDTTDNQSVGIATASGVAAGARVLSVCFSSNPGGWVEPMASELANVVGVDGAGSAASGIGTTATAGTLAPSGSDLLYQVVYTPGGPPTSFTAASGSLLSADIRDGWAGQYGAFATSAAPSISLGSSVHWATAAVLLRTGVAGSVPPGMRIVHLLHENLPTSAAGGGINNYYPVPVSLELPCSGNLLVAAIGGGSGASDVPFVTGLTDTNANTWLQVPKAARGDVMSQLFYAPAATPGALMLSVAWNSNQTDDSTFMFYDVAGAATAPLDVAASAGGEMDSPGNFTVPFTITPAVVGELVILATPWDFDTAAGLVGGLIDTNLASGESESGAFPVDENNGWGHAWSPSTAPMSFTWVPLFDEIEFGISASVAAAFKPAP